MPPRAVVVAPITRGAAGSPPEPAPESEPSARFGADAANDDDSADAYASEEEEDWEGLLQESDHDDDGSAQDTLNTAACADESSAAAAIANDSTTDSAAGPVKSIALMRATKAAAAAAKAASVRSVGTAADSGANARAQPLAQPRTQPLPQPLALTLTPAAAAAAALIARAPHNNSNSNSRLHTTNSRSGVVTASINARSTVNSNGHATGRHNDNDTEQLVARARQPGLGQARPHTVAPLHEEDLRGMDHRADNWSLSSSSAARPGATNANSRLNTPAGLSRPPAAANNSRASSGSSSSSSSRGAASSSAPNYSAAQTRGHVHGHNGHGGGGGHGHSHSRGHDEDDDGHGHGHGDARRQRPRPQEPRHGGRHGDSNLSTTPYLALAAILAAALALLTVVAAPTPAQWAGAAFAAVTTAETTVGGGGGGALTGGANGARTITVTRVTSTGESASATVSPVGVIAAVLRSLGTLRQEGSGALTSAGENDSADKSKSSSGEAAAGAPKPHGYEAWTAATAAAETTAEWLQYALPLPQWRAVPKKAAGKSFYWRQQASSVDDGNEGGHSLWAHWTGSGASQAKSGGSGKSKSSAGDAVAETESIADALLTSAAAVNAAALHSNSVAASTSLAALTAAAGSLPAGVTPALPPLAHSHFTHSLYAHGHSEGLSSSASASVTAAAAAAVVVANTVSDITATRGHGSEKLGFVNAVRTLAIETSVQHGVTAASVKSDAVTVAQALMTTSLFNGLSLSANPTFNSSSTHCDASTSSSFFTADTTAAVSASARALVGRTEPLSSFFFAMTAPVAGPAAFAAPRVVYVAGDAGSGRTSLVAHALTAPFAERPNFKTATATRRITDSADTQQQQQQQCNARDGDGVYHHYFVLPSSPSFWLSADSPASLLSSYLALIDYLALAPAAAGSGALSSAPGITAAAAAAATATTGTGPHGPASGAGALSLREAAAVLNAYLLTLPSWTLVFDGADSAEMVSIVESAGGVRGTTTASASVSAKSKQANATFSNISRAKCGGLTFIMPQPTHDECSAAFAAMSSGNVTKTAGNDAFASRFGFSKGFSTMPLFPAPLSLTAPVSARDAAATVAARCRCDSQAQAQSGSENETDAEAESDREQWSFDRAWPQAKGLVIVTTTNAALAAGSRFAPKPSTLQSPSQYSVNEIGSDVSELLSALHMPATTALSYTPATGKFSTNSSVSDLSVSRVLGGSSDGSGRVSAALTAAHSYVRLAALPALSYLDSMRVLTLATGIPLDSWLVASAARACTADARSRAAAASAVAAAAALATAAGGAPANLHTAAPLLLDAVALAAAEAAEAAADAAADAASSGGQASVSLSSMFDDGVLTTALSRVAAAISAATADPALAAAAMAAHGPAPARQSKSGLSGGDGGVVRRAAVAALLLQAHYKRLPVDTVAAPSLSVVRQARKQHQQQTEAAANNAHGVDVAVALAAARVANNSHIALPAVPGDSEASAADSALKLLTVTPRLLTVSQLADWADSAAAATAAALTVTLSANLDTASAKSTSEVLLGPGLALPLIGSYLSPASLARSSHAHAPVSTAVAASAMSASASAGAGAGRGGDVGVSMFALFSNPDFIHAVKHPLRAFEGLESAQNISQAQQSKQG